MDIEIKIILTLIVPLVVSGRMIVSVLDRNSALWKQAITTGVFFVSFIGMYVSFLWWIWS